MLRTPTQAADQTDRTERLLAAVRVALVAALVALVLAIAALAYVVSFEAIRAFAVETAAFPPALAWSAPLLVDSFTTAASLVILWRYLRGEGWRAPWYAWTLVGCATAVSVALNVAHAPERVSAQLFAALPPVALLGALELLMSVARTGLPHTDRTPHCGGSQHRQRLHCDPRWSAAATRIRPHRDRRQRQPAAARQPHPGPRAGRPRARHRHPPGCPRCRRRGRDQRTPRL
jgi:hypothetical protein